MKNKPTLTEQLASPIVLAVGALLIALDVVLNMFNITLSPTLQIGFNYIAKAISGFLVGPALSGVVAVFSDIIGFFLNPSGAFFWGFTFNALVEGLIFGFVLYKKPITWQRVAIALLLRAVVVQMILTPIWLNMMYQTPLFVQARYVKTLILFPIEFFTTFAILKTMEKTIAPRFFALVSRKQDTK